MTHIPHRVAEKHAYADSFESQACIQPFSLRIVLIHDQCNVGMSFGMRLGCHRLKQRTADTMSPEQLKHSDRIQIDTDMILLLKEAGLKNNAAAVDLAVNLLRILCKADALNLCSALDHH